MCPGDSSMSQISHAPSAQRLARDAGIEKELTDYLQKQFLKQKDDMETMERERKVQATEFQERLDKQWQLLTEIRNLVMLSKQEGKRKELDENWYFSGLMKKYWWKKLEIMLTETSRYHYYIFRYLTTRMCFFVLISFCTSPPYDQVKWIFAWSLHSALFTWNCWSIFIRGLCFEKPPLFQVCKNHCNKNR